MSIFYTEIIKINVKNNVKKLLKRLLITNETIYAILAKKGGIKMETVKMNDIENIMVGDVDYQAKGLPVNVLAIRGKMISWVGPNDEIMAGFFEFSAGAAIVLPDEMEVLTI